MQIDNKCPGCGGELRFDFDSQELKCLQCDGIVDIPDIKFINQKYEFNENSTIKQKQVESLTYKCENCGRICVINSSAESLRCLYCNSPNLSTQSKVEYIPDGIVPFKLNSKRALTCFIDWLKTKKFLPKNLKKQIGSGKLSALYLPIYNYDFECFSSYSGLGVDYREDSQGNKIESTRHFSGTREFNFTNYIESANSYFSSKDLKAFGNFDFNKLYVYRTEYLYGITSVEVDISLQNNCKTAQRKIKDIIERKIKDSYNFDEIINFTCDTDFNKIAYNHLYVPVWVKKFDYNKKNYTFFINGSTGKVSGKVPRSILKILLTVFGIIAGAGLIGLLTYLLTI